MPLRWRLQKQVRTNGNTYFALIRGSGEERRCIGLGYITPEQAERAVSFMIYEDTRTAGTAEFDGVLRMLDEQPQLRERFVASLLEDDEAVIRGVFGAPPKKHSLMALQDYHREHFWPARTEGEPNLPPVARSTARSEGGFWRQINKKIGHVRLADLDPWVWEDYVASMTQHPRTRSMHRAAYKALLDYAHRKRHIEQVHTFFPIKGSTSRARPKVAPLTVEEIARLLRVAEHGADTVYSEADQLKGKGKKGTKKGHIAGSPMRRCMWAVGVGQGLRPSELARCHFEDFDLDDSVMYVRGDPDRDGRGKTAESATLIPMTPFTVREVRRYIEVAARKTGPMFVWHDPADQTEKNKERKRKRKDRGKRKKATEGDSEEVRPTKEFKEALAQHAEAAGITRFEKVRLPNGQVQMKRRAITPYLLRHSFATLCWNLGIDKEVTRRIGRWTTDDMLDEVYCRPSPKDLAARLTAFDFDLEAVRAAEEKRETEKVLRFSTK